jgi:hypothetical protein
MKNKKNIWPKKNGLYHGMMQYRYIDNYKLRGRIEQARIGVRHGVQIWFMYER